jgi:hypothetical protein
MDKAPLLGADSTMPYSTLRPTVQNRQLGRSNSTPIPVTANLVIER